MYAFSKPLLPFSHAADEVVHGKKSLMHKMGRSCQSPADSVTSVSIRIFAIQVRNYLMGSELPLEWPQLCELEWGNLEMKWMLRCVVSLLSSIISTKNTRNCGDWLCFDARDIDADNRDQSVLSMIRHQRRSLVCVFNMAPVERKDLTLVCLYQRSMKKLNKVTRRMGGVWKHNPTVQSQDGSWKDFEQTLTFTLRL